MTLYIEVAMREIEVAANFYDKGHFNEKRNIRRELKIMKDEGNIQYPLGTKTIKKGLH